MPSSASHRLPPRFTASLIRQISYRHILLGPLQLRNKRPETPETRRLNAPKSLKS